jgi:hypothetical protein
MIAPVTVAGILIMAVLASMSSTNQAFAYSSYHKTYYKGHHAYYKNSEYTKRQGNIPTSNTGNQAQGVSTTREGGPSRIVVGESDGTVGLDTTKQGQTTGSSAAQGGPQSSNGNAAQGATNVKTAKGASNANTAQGASNGKLVVSNLANFSKSFPNPGPLLGKMTDNQLWGANFGILK